MLLGMRGRPATLTTLAATALLGLSAATATAATGGAGMTEPAPKQAAPAPAAVQPPPAPTLSPLASLPQLAAGVTLRKVSRSAVSAATLAYSSYASGRLTVRVDVVRLADGLSVFTDQRTVAPGVTQTITWNGRARRGLALDGRYQLRIALAAQAGTSRTTGAAPGGAAPQAAAPPPGSTSVRTFTFVGAIFPVRGPHTFGTGADAFGASRAGHIHQGQDVLARCGTPLVAARGGTVIQRAFQSLAGNYLVIQDPITGQSNVYAHLRTPAIVRRGQHVETGQAIGVVGETGDATACHLHFELWTAPGWYQGGSPIDPLPTLKAWDKLS